MHVEIVETTSLGDRSYVVHDGSHAAVVDPQRDVDRVLAVLDEHGLELVAVLETHLHNDYVSGGLELAHRTGATLHVAAADEVTFDHVGVSDGDVVEVGTLELHARHAPGHTFNHLAWVVVEDGAPQAVLTGGSLLYGSVGRTDLLGDDHTEELTRLQHRSVRSMGDDLEDPVAVLPTHGFGSFCSSGDTVERETSTIGREREDNDAFTIDDEDAFVDHLVDGLDAHPAYYAHMSPLNLAGPQAVDLSPPVRLDADEVRRRIDAGEWVVDLRDARTFAAGHLEGAVNVGLADPASTYLGWVVPWGMPLTLLGTAEDVAAMQRQLVRIGIDRPAGWADPDGLDAAADYPVSDFAGVRDELGDGDVVLDVRRDGEWADGHLADAVHVPLHELLDRLDELPDGRLWVHCASGYRASIGASLLHRHGREVVLVDDEFANAGDHHELVD